MLQTLLFYAATEKWPLECVFVYNFVSRSVRIFLSQAFVTFW